jgi:hypothetical protein
MPLWDRIVEWTNMYINNGFWFNIIKMTKTPTATITDMSRLAKTMRNPKAAASYALRKLGLMDSEYNDWSKRQFAAPSPHFIKQTVLLRNGLDDATWVETGTFMGDTTNLLSKSAKKVYSIEPEPSLFCKAEQRFRDASNVKIIRGLSEEIFPNLLPTLSGDICFWLDGHYSQGVTFKGPQDTPILDELKNIEMIIAKKGKIVVMIDDLRLFGSKETAYSNYPPLDFLVDWARKNNLNWHIEHDIFIAKTH